MGLDYDRWRPAKSLHDLSRIHTTSRFGAQISAESDHRTRVSVVDGSFSNDELEMGGSFVIPSGTGLLRNLDLDFHLELRDSPVLLVVFHGALNRAKYKLPRFEYQSTLRNVPYNMLFIADPTLYIHESIQLGWYVGSEIDDAHAGIAALVTAVASTIGTSSVVLVGSSGGGFAALATSILLPGSTVLAFSPQTAIERYHRGYSTRLSSLAFPESSRDEASINQFEKRFSLCSLYRHSERQNRIWYVQNTGDPLHFKEHLLPFASALGLDLSAGIAATADTRVDMAYLREGHGVASKNEMLDYVRRAVEWTTE